MMKKNKQLFFSHTWRPDNLGRNTHKRVHTIVKKLRNNGWTTWFDEEDMGGNIDAAMAEGIENADAILICLTETYCKKVNETAKNPRNRDNCLKEWTYANMRNKLLIPIIMEPCLLNTNNWPPGIVSLYLGSTLYINATDNDLSESVIFANSFLLNNGLQPHNKTQNLFINVIKKKSTSPKSTSPKSTSPNSTSPKSTSPKSTSPKSTSPKSTSPKVNSPKVNSPKVNSSRSLINTISNTITNTFNKFSPKTSPTTTPTPSPKLPRPPTENKSKFINYKNKFRKHRSPPPPPPPQPIQNLNKNTETNINVNNLYLKSDIKLIELTNRRISENNVFANYISSKIIKKSKSTGDFTNLCI